MVRSSVSAPKFDKHLKTAERHFGQNIENITIKMKTIVWKPWIIKNHQVSSKKFRHVSPS